MKQKINLPYLWKLRTQDNEFFKKFRTQISAGYEFSRQYEMAQERNERFARKWRISYS